MVGGTRHSEEGAASKTEELIGTEAVEKLSLCDIGDDSLSAVLSFLSPLDIVKCAAVCQHMRAFCKADSKVWLPMCERRWGAQTSVHKWGRGKISFKLLHSVLTQLENLIGFWRGVAQESHGSLVTFEWGPHFVTGFRVTAARPGSHGVCKVPFVWIGASDTGRPVCFFDTQKPVNCCTDAAESLTSGELSTKQAPGGQGVSTTRRRNPFAALGPDEDLELHSPPVGLVVVDLHFVGKFHIVMEELQHPYHRSRSLTEAAMVTSFGSSGNNRRGSWTASELEAHSPPGSFQYEMFNFLASKVTSQGGERAAQRQRRRERERAFIQGRRTCEPEHFVKVRDVGPSAARPLQGLWKGICDSMGLDFLLLLYDDHGGIICRRVGESLGATHTGSVCWTAEPERAIQPPLPDNEHSIFNERQRIWSESDFDECDEEVIEMLSTHPIRQPDFDSSSTREGRVWRYASGRFGLGFSPKGFVIDFRPLCSPSGHLLDVLT